MTLLWLVLVPRQAAAEGNTFGHPKDSQRSLAVSCAGTLGGVCVMCYHQEMNASEDSAAKMAQNEHSWKCC